MTEAGAPVHQQPNPNKQQKGGRSAIELDMDRIREIQCGSGRRANAPVPGPVHAFSDLPRDALSTVFRSAHDHRIEVIGGADSKE